MKKILAAVIIIFFIAFLGILICMRFIGQTEDSRHIKAEIKGLNGYQLPGTTTKYVQIPGKYDDVTIEIAFAGEILNDLLIEPKDIIVQGIEFTHDDRSKFLLKNIKILSDKRLKIYIPAGTVVTQSGYALQDDFIISDIQFVTSSSETWQHVQKPLLKYAFWALCAAITILLLMLLNNKVLVRFDHKFEFDKGVINIAMCIIASIFIIVLSGLLTSQFGRCSYQNEIMIILMMSMYLVPLGTFVVYKLIMTVIHNIQAIGFFGGIGMFILQFIATFTVIYVFAIVVGGGTVASAAITKKLMNE